jgi:hypothetical protein
MNSEKGQALPLSILVLALGTLIITPFLGHASSSVIGSGVYAQAIMEQYAADAGVEHAVWSLTNDGLADQLPNPGDEITYQLGEPVNGLMPTVTITANVTASGETTMMATSRISFISQAKFMPSPTAAPATMASSRQ